MNRIFRRKYTALHEFSAFFFHRLYFSRTKSMEWLELNLQISNLPGFMILSFQIYESSIFQTFVALNYRTIKFSNSFISLQVLLNPEFRTFKF